MTSLQSTSPPLIAAKQQAPARVDSPARIRSSSGTWSSAVGQLLAKDIESLRDAINGLHGTLKTTQSLSQLLIRNSDTGQVVAAIGDLIFDGVYYTNYFSEIHVGDPLATRNPAQALFNANTDGSVTVGQSGWLDVLDYWGGNAAWLGTQNDTLTITGAADNGAGLIRLEVIAHQLGGAGTYVVRNMAAAGVPNAQGAWAIQIADVDHVDLLGSVWAGKFVAPTGVGIDTFSPNVDRGIGILSITNNGAGLMRIRTNVAHHCEDGDTVSLFGLGGTPTADGRWVVRVVTPTRVDLIDSVFGTGYSIIDATFLRFFAGILAQTFAIGDSFQNYKLRAFADGSLKINDATITLTSANGEIIISPTDPSIELIAQGGSTSIAVTTESPQAITATTNASPDVITIVGHGYVNGDTVHIQSSTGDTAINGYRIVENITANTFQLTDFAGVAINGNGAYAGGGTATRYYAGILTNTIGIGDSFATAKLRAFADGRLVINGAEVTGSALSGTFTSTTGTTPNVLTLLISNGVLTISGTGTQAGNGSITMDGDLSVRSVVASTLITSPAYKVGATLGADGSIGIAGLTLAFAKGIFTGSAGSFPVGSTSSVAFAGLTLSFTSGVFTGTSGSFPTGTTGSASIGGIILDFTSGILTSIIGAFPSGISTTATVRNAAGTGTSALSFVNGVLTAYTP